MAPSPQPNGGGGGIQLPGGLPGVEVPPPEKVRDGAFDIVAGLPLIVWQVVAALLVLIVLRQISEKLPWKTMFFALLAGMLLYTYRDKFGR